MKQRSARNQPSSGFNHTFALIFAFLGAFFFRDVATAAIARAFPSAGTTSLAGFLIAAVLGGCAGAVLDELFGAKRSRAKVLHPDEPWLWDEEWAAGRIAYSNFGAAIGLGVGSAVADFFVFAIFVALLEQFSFGFLVVFLMFGAVALTMSALTVMLVRHQFAFGKSELVLETIPGVIGNELAGAVEVRMASTDRSLEFQVSLVRSGPGRQGDLWKKEIVVAAGALRRRGELVEIPFRFELPDDLPISGKSGASYSVRVSSNAKPVSYNANFSVPIFRTFESAPVAPKSASEPVAEEPRQGVGLRIAGITFASVAFLAFSAAPLFAMYFGGTLFFAWLRAGREDLGRAGKHATTLRRDCEFFYEGTAQKRRFSARTHYVYEVGEKVFACRASNGFEADEKHGPCPCSSLDEAERDKLQKTRCEEHVDVLYDPAHPADCRPADQIGRRSPYEKDELLVGFLCIAGGAATMIQIARRALS